MRRVLTICLAGIVLGAATADAADPDYFAALAAYQEILSREPANGAALRGKIQTLARLGAPQLALELAERHPGILEPSERDAIAADRTAHRIRWGAISADTGRGPERFVDIDRALADSEAAGIRALDPAAQLTATERQLALDRIGALRERFRMRDAVALHAAMAARPGLFYALAESEEHDAALAQIKRAVAATPERIDAWSPATIRENPAHARVLSARAMAPLFANRPGEAP